MDVIFLKSLRPLYCDYISRILCVRRAQQGRPPRPPFMYFYSRPCARGDRSFIPVPTFWLHFYSRPYARGDLRRAVLRTLPLLISTRAPTRGATYRVKPYPLTDEQFLLAPLHEGRLREIFNEHFCLLISTRAPTRGATQHPRGNGCAHRDFYSRPYTRGDSIFSQNHKLIYMINC